MSKIQPRYPVYIPSKGRADCCAAARFLRRDGVPFFLVIEAQERDLYAAEFGSDCLLVLPFSDAGSVIPARNWIKAHATARGAERHWQFDDNIRMIRRRAAEGRRIPVESGVALAAVEDWTDRYENVAITGLDYQMFMPPHTRSAPFTLNCRVYSCLVPGTRVLKADLSWRPIETLAPGDLIIGFDEEPPDTQYRHFHPATVLSTATIVRPIYRVTLDDGRQVFASDDHRWLGRAQLSRKAKGRPPKEGPGRFWRWITTEDLHPGALIRDFGMPWEADESWDAGWLGGILDGEGYLVRGRSVAGFAQSLGAVYEKAVTLLGQRGFPAQRGETRANGVWNWNVGGLYNISRLLGTVRPVRLLEKVPAWIDCHTLNPFGAAEVVEVKAVGDAEVIAVGTSTSTLIAEGLFSHNCALILNSLPYRWRGRYNEDTDLCLQALAGGWCTVLIHAFMIDKPQTMKVKGGNTQVLYQGDGRLKMARALERLWPGVVETKRRFQRPQHHVKDGWKRFDTPMKLKPGIDLAAIPPNDYGLKLKAVKEVQSERLQQLLDASNAPV